MSKRLFNQGLRATFGFCLFLNSVVVFGSSSYASVPFSTGYEETRREGLVAFPRWTDVLKRHNRFPPVTTSFLESINNELPKQQLKHVNDFWNKVPYAVDPMNYGAADYWATPSEMLKIVVRNDESGERGGDCEDYAIAKYFSLRALGWSPAHMRIMVVFDRNLRLPHAVLVVWHQGKWLLLDNQLAFIVTTDQVRHYRPIFSLGERGWWRHVPRSSDTAAIGVETAP